MKEKINKRNPVTVNKDVWFYLNEKTLEFIVWTKATANHPRQVTSFRIKHSLLNKYMGLD